MFGGLIAEHFARDLLSVSISILFLRFMSHEKYQAGLPKGPRYHEK